MKCKEKYGITDLLGKILPTVEVEKDRIFNVGHDFPLMRDRCMSCHSQKTLSFFVVGLSGSSTYSFSICARCGRPDRETVFKGHPEFELMSPSAIEHPKHIRLEINPKTVKTEIVDNWSYRK